MRCRDLLYLRTPRKGVPGNVTVLSLLALSLALSATGCARPVTETPARAPAATNPTVRSLRGDPGFAEERLPADVRVWYTRMWSDLNVPRPTPDLTEHAASGDIWYLGRPLNSGISSLLAAFRVTGDLRILDEIDRVMQLARAELKDYNGDGFLNWRYLNPRNNKQLYPDDVGAASMWDMETHALTAAVAYAFRVNEDLESPGGVPYKERAAFWQDYLKNHFEAKWRSRNQRPTGYPIVERTLLHPFSQFIRFHHYMGQLTGDGSYGEYGLEMAKRLMAVTREAEVSGGPAYVFGRTSCSPTGPFRSPSPTPASPSARCRT